MTEKKVLLAAPNNIPVEIQQMAKEAQIGELCKVYSASKKDIKQAGKIFIITGSVFLGIMALILILIVIIGNVDAHFLPVLMLSLGIPFLILSLIFLLPGYYMAFHRGIYPYWHVYLYQNGFVYEKGKVRQAFRWNQIVSIEGNVKQVEYRHSNGRHTFVEEKTIYFYKIRNQDGCEIELSNIFPEIAELIDILLEESARQLAPREINIADSRRVVTFTNFALDGQGIGNGLEKVSWEEIHEVIMKNGTAVICKVEL